MQIVHIYVHYFFCVQHYLKLKNKQTEDMPLFVCKHYSFDIHIQQNNSLLIFYNKTMIIYLNIKNKPGEENEKLDQSFHVRCSY